jgi:hypothetical protein
MQSIQIEWHIAAFRITIYEDRLKILVKYILYGKAFHDEKKKKHHLVVGSIISHF